MKLPSDMRNANGFRSMKYIYLFIFAAIFTILYFINIIDVGFNDSDSYLYRLTSGEYTQQDLPAVVQEVGFPTNLEEINHYNTTIIGRLWAYPYVGYAYAHVFGQNASLWRIPLVIVFILTLYIIYRIGILFKNDKINLALFVLLFYLLFWKYMIVEHLYNYLFAEFFFLLAIYIELKDRNKNLTQHMLIGLLIFLSLFVRELTILAIIPLGIFVFFNMKPFQSNTTKKINLNGTIPYFMGVVIYFLLYLFLIPQSDGQYIARLNFSNLLFSIKNEMVHVLSFGFVNRYNELLLFSSFILFLLFITIAKYRKIFIYLTKKWSILTFMGSIVLFYILGYSFMQTSAYFIPFLAMAVIYLIIFHVLFEVYLRGIKYANHIRLAGILTIFLVIGMESYKEMEKYRVKNKLFYKTSEYISKTAPRNSCIELNNLSIAPRYGFVVDNFVTYGRSDIKYKIPDEESSDLIGDTYTSYYSTPFIKESISPDYRIYFNVSEKTLAKYQSQPHVKVIRSNKLWYPSNEELATIIINDKG